MSRSTQASSRFGSHRFRLTETGRGIFIGTVFVFLACLVIPAFGILAALIVLQVVALAIGWWFRPRLRLLGSWPTQATAGQPISGRFTLENPTPYPLYKLLMEPVHWPEEIQPQQDSWPIPAIPAGERHTVTITADCWHRGRYRLEIPACTSSFPFNLYRFGSTAPPAQEVLVFPAFRRLNLHALMGTGAEQGRTGHTRRWVGSSPEYIGSRPFLPGDSPRRIDARAWARLAHPAVKEFFDESQQAVALILETWVGGSAKHISAQQQQDFEAAVSWAASLAYSLPRHASLDLLALGPDTYTIPEQNLSQQIDAVHRHLATVNVHEKPRSTASQSHLIDQLTQIQELVIVGVCWNEQTHRLAEIAQQLGCHVVMYRVCTDPEPAEVSPLPGIQSHHIPSRNWDVHERVAPW